MISNGPACAQIGTSILKKNGTAVDAAIAALFCEGVSVPNCMGLGGGFLMNIYIKDGGKSDFLIAREVAPEKANETMFGKDEDSAIRGGLAVAVPGELKGYWEAYNKYGGGVPWKDLVQPTIDLCNEGIPVTKYLAAVTDTYKEDIMKDDILRYVSRTLKLIPQFDFLGGFLSKQRQTKRMQKPKKSLDLVSLKPWN